MPGCRTCNEERQGDPKYPIRSRDWPHHLTGMLRCEHCATVKECKSSFEWSPGPKKHQNVVYCSCEEDAAQKQRNEEAERVREAETKIRLETAEKKHQAHVQKLIRCKSQLLQKRSFDDVKTLLEVKIALDLFKNDKQNYYEEQEQEELVSSDIVVSHLQRVANKYFSIVVDDYRYTVLSANPDLNAVYEWLMVQTRKIDTKREFTFGPLNVVYPRCDIDSDPHAVWRRHNMQSPRVIVSPRQWKADVADLVRVFKEQSEMLHRFSRQSIST